MVKNLPNMFPSYSLHWIKLGQTSWRAASAKISAFYAITVPYSITGKLMRQTSMFLAPWSRVLLFDTVSLKRKNRLALLRSTDWCDPVIIPLTRNVFFALVLWGNFPQIIIQAKMAVNFTTVSYPFRRSLGRKW